MKRAAMVDIIHKKLEQLAEESLIYGAEAGDPIIEREAADKLLKVLEDWQMKRVINDKVEGWDK